MSGVDRNLLRELADAPGWRVEANARELSDGVFALLDELEAVEAEVERVSAERDFVEQSVVEFTKSKHLKRALDAEAWIAAVRDLAEAEQLGECDAGSVLRALRDLPPVVTP